MTGHRTLYEWFSGTAARVPTRPAIEVGPDSLTYAELADLAGGIAARLAASRAGPLLRVGLLAARTLNAYAGYLAVLRLGATVVPLNPAFPAARNLEIIAQAGAEAILVDDADDAAALGPTGPPLVRMDSTDTAGQRARPRRPGPDEIAYLLFTSGSTGRPKGVPISHRNIAPFLRHTIQRYRVGPGSRLSQTFELTFDGSVLDMFVAWGAGATLVVPTRQEILEPVDFVVDKRLTHWCSVPSVISLACTMNSLPVASMPFLRWSMFSGEQLTLDHAEAWAQAASGGALDNLYGPTEVSVTVSSYRLPSARSAWSVTSNRTVPIGRVYPHLEWLVVDDGGRPADAGELCLRGPQRFHGYLNPADNAGRFLRLVAGRGEEPASGEVTPEDWYRTGDDVAVEDGQLVHLGRRDRQVQVRGYRVEPSEIELLLRNEPGVSDVVVMAAPGTGGLTTLVAVVAGRPGSPVALATALRRRLPAYMIPDRFERVDRLPVNANGKVDRRALEQQYAVPPAAEEAR